jgi:hypothetical protein
MIARFGKAGDFLGERRAAGCDNQQIPVVMLLTGTVQSTLLKIEDSILSVIN